jgi:predicted DNA-binding protein
MSAPTTIRLEADQPERIRVLAVSTMRTQAGLIRYALELGLRQLEQQEQQEQQNQRAEV